MLMPVFAKVGKMIDPKGYGERVRAARRAMRPPWSQYDLANELGWTRAKISSIEGEMLKEFPEHSIREIAEALGRPFEYFTGDTESTALAVAERRQRYQKNFKAEETVRLKIYGGISAGDGNTSSIDPDEIDIPLEYARQDFGALYVEGDSMMPYLQPSDLVIFRDWTKEKIGYIFAAELEDSTWVVKALVYEGGKFKLRSANPDYADIEGPFKLTGYFVGFIRDDGPRRTMMLDGRGLKLDDLPRVG